MPEHNEEQQRLPGEADLPLLPPLLSDEEQRRKADKEAENAYKDRQLALGQANVNLATSNRKLTFWLAIFAGVAAIAALWQGWISDTNAESAERATLIAQQNFRESRRNADLQRHITSEQFRKDQRPYVGQTSKSTEGPKWLERPNDPQMGQILWTWHMTNYGKTPANNISYSQEIKIGDKPFVLSFEEKGRDIGAPLPTGQDALATVVSSPMQKAEFEKLLRMEESVSIRILISYGDSEGRQYNSGLCLKRTNAGSISYCKKGNYIE